MTDLKTLMAACPNLMVVSVGDTPKAEPALPTFDTIDEAGEWAVEQADDPCIDNCRFAFDGDEEAEAEYQRRLDQGCCGFFDADVIVAGRKARVGCNYGH